MIHVAGRLAIADAWHEPGRTIAVVVLLVAAAWLPTIADAPALLGVPVAVAAAFAAAVGAVGLTERRGVVLQQNGARLGFQVLVAAASMAVVGVVACVVTLVSALVLGSGPSPTAMLLVTLVIPTVTAPVARWATLRAEGSGQATLFGLRGWPRGIAIGVVVVACVGFLPLGLLVLGVYLASGAWSTDRLRRILSLIAAVLVLPVAVYHLGVSESWWDLSFALLIVIPILVVAVAVLAVHAHTLVVGGTARFGPRLHLALAPLALQRRVLAPLVALATLVLTIAVTSGVVGASFGEREALRQQAADQMPHRAGNATDQAIVPVPPVDAGALRKVVADTVRGSGATGTVIEQVGTGDTAALGFAVQAWADRSFFSISEAPSLATSVALVSPGPPDDRSAHPPYRPQWLGVIEPDELGALGWAAAAGPVKAGSLAIVGEAELGPGGTVQVAAGSGLVSRPAVRVDVGRSGTLLPGALVARRAVAGLSPLVTTARVVLVPTPGAAETPSVEQLVSLGRRIQDGALKLPTVEPRGLTEAQRAAVDTYVLLSRTDAGIGPVVSGAHRFDLSRGGPLNAVPIFTGTSDGGRREASTLVILPILITLAVVFLALGSTRRDDHILEVQGAPGRLRSQLAAVQSGVLTVTAAAVAVVLGIGVPAGCFAVYNGRATLPDIPLVVPDFVWVIVIGVPVATTALAALVPLFRRRSNPTPEHWSDLPL